MRSSRRSATTAWGSRRSGSPTPPPPPPDITITSPRPIAVSDHRDSAAAAGHAARDTARRDALAVTLHHPPHRVGGPEDRRLLETHAAPEGSGAARVGDQLAVEDQHRLLALEHLDVGHSRPLHRLGPVAVLAVHDRLRPAADPDRG